MAPPPLLTESNNMSRGRMHPRRIPDEDGGANCRLEALVYVFCLNTAANVLKAVRAGESLRNQMRERLPFVELLATARPTGFVS